MIENQYKNEAVYLAAHSVPWHPTLLALEIWFYERYGRQVYTSAYRAHKIHSGDSGIHSTDPLRANDKRTMGLHPYPMDVAQDVNKHWQYDPKRPNLKVCMYHDTGQGFHFHYQIHDRTRRIK